MVADSVWRCSIPMLIHIRSQGTISLSMSTVLPDADNVHTVRACMGLRGHCNNAEVFCLQLNALQESPYVWLSELLHCFSDGDLNRFSKLCVDRAPQMNSQPALVQNQAKLKEKITIMSFVALVSACASYTLLS